jgi:2-polyprenyl-6-methoxyphenol hydroxylase-like FAD-dependent oxidoreductase
MSQGATRDFDVVIAGGSLAGCTAATLYARRGLRVALLEKRPNMDAYKVVCAHFIQGGATPMLKRHGFAEMMEAAGAVRNRADLRTRWGWIRGDAPHHGYTLRREVLDPMLRANAAETPGVELLMGHTVQELLWSDGRVTGLVARTRDGRRHSFRAPLVVAADGRDSPLARMAHNPGRVLPHNRFAYWCYVRGLPRRTDGAADAWFLDPEVALIEPCDGDLHCVVASPPKWRLPEFKRDVESAWLRFIEALPEGPPIRDAERVSRFIGKLDTPNVARPAAKHGMAFIGDACTASDPIWAVGCGWAFQSSEWLVDETTPVIGEGGNMERALRRYHRRHMYEIGLHHLVGSNYSTARPFSPVERLMYSAATRDQAVADQMHTLVTRAHPAQDFVRPRTFARALKVLATKPRQTPETDKRPVYVSPMGRNGNGNGNGGGAHAPAMNGSPPTEAVTGGGVAWPT